MSDLVSLERAREQLINLQGCDDGILASLISAASEAIEGYTRRILTQQTYDVLVHGTGTEFMFLDNPPVSRVSIRTQLLPAIYILCADAGAQTQTANVEVSLTGITLTRTYNNATTTNNFTYAAYPTFAVLATAINALGNTWKATLTPQFQFWQTSDLALNQNGIYSAKNATIPLSVYWYGLPAFKVNEELGEVYNAGGWVSGYEAYRITYTGGFNPIPDDIQHATASLVQLCFATRNANPLMVSETLDKYSYTRNAMMNMKNLDAATLLTLNKYKLMRVARYKV